MDETTRLSANPRVSIGLPVYNGENYVAAAIESILGQTLTDFEFIISDNASTDQTADICTAYARRDSRIRFIRHDVNRGAAWNFNYVLEVSRGPYFKWAAHDDVLAAEYLHECASVLDRDPTVVLCYPRTLRIDEQGRPFAERRTSELVASTDPIVRFADQIKNNNSCEHVFGLVRRDVLKQTSLMGSYTPADRVLLSELALRGRFHEVPKPLFQNRNHSERSIRAHSTAYAMSEWFAGTPTKNWSPATLTLFNRFLSAIRKSELSWTKRGRGYSSTMRWLVASRSMLKADLIYSARRFVRLCRYRESASAFVEHIESELKTVGRRITPEQTER
jgi:glycosyltransferase involved in cell wall biosynthesis